MTRKMAQIFVRVFLVVISYTMDIKVRADVTIKSHTGYLEIQKDQALLKLEKKSRIIEPVDVQTFSKSNIQFSLNDVTIGLDENTLISCESSPQCGLISGRALITLSQKSEADWFSLRTPQGIVMTGTGEALVEVSKEKTVVSVVSGTVKVKDRASGRIYAVTPGYSFWIGGLLSSGFHQVGAPTAMDLSAVMIDVKNLGHYDTEAWQYRYDHVRPPWKQAVEDVANQNQNQIFQSFEKDKVDREKAFLRDQAQRKAHARLQAEFRRRSLYGLPSENTEDPSASRRSPANSDE